GHEEDRVDVRSEPPIVVGELQLGLEIADRPEAADDDRGPDPVAEVNGPSVERVDDDPVPGAGARGAERVADYRHPVLGRQERALAGGLHDSAGHTIRAAGAPA